MLNVFRLSVEKEPACPSAFGPDFCSAASWLRHASRASPPFQLPNVLHRRKTKDEMNHETHEAHETGNHAKDFQRKDAKTQRCEGANKVGRVTPCAPSSGLSAARTE
jgi:hypothetical protein